MCTKAFPNPCLIAYGPIPLVAQSADTDYLELSFYQDFTLSGDLTHAIAPASAPMTFTTNGYTLVQSQVVSAAGRVQLSA
jgi:hypothetical protein